MNHKEKTKELVYKFYEFSQGDCTPTYKESDHLEKLNNAKQCALICVDEIINQGGTNVLGHGSNYWKQVKEEILKL